LSPKEVKLSKKQQAPLYYPKRKSVEKLKLIPSARKLRKSTEQLSPETVHEEVELQPRKIKKKGKRYKKLSPEMELPYQKFIM